MSDHLYHPNDFEQTNHISEEVDSVSESEANEFEQAVESETESSYEWNAESRQSDNEYHYSYINGNNSSASHNPNNYDDAYSTVRSSQSDASSYQSQGTAFHNYGEPSEDRTRVYHYGTNPNHTNAKRERKHSKAASRGFVAAALAITMLGSTAAGLGGGYLIGRQSTPAATSNGMTIKQVASGDSDQSATNVAYSENSTVTTADIVKKTANSVVEIATEITQTSAFGRQYNAKAAGSGVIISEDGYIVTNHHVIENASKITVTLRDGTTSYDAKLIGSDADNDIALLKVDASGLSAATFGNSSNLVVGDYVVAIGKPLGTLGGTVTDGIISALAREVTIENKHLTLLQTNAQISPGNSGGGLFNAKGELIGIVNAKDSATEVEGIAFAIPINNVVGIIRDLKDYGYVTGKIDTGMKFVDINSYGTAFYYNVNTLGVYVLSVEQGSKAEEAGFETGNLITAVNGTSVSSEADIQKALENNKVGDVVTFTVQTRSGETKNIKLELTEYVPSVKPNNEEDQQEFQSNDGLWDQLLNW